MAFSSDPAVYSNQLPESFELPSVINPQLFDEALHLWLTRAVEAINTKEGSLYQTTENATFQRYITSILNGQPKNRSVYRKVIDFGALPNTGTTSVAHGISFTSDYRLTRVYGASTDPSGLSYLPLPYASPTAANNIELSLTSTNVVITTGSNRSAYTSTTVVIEYTKVAP